MTIHTQFLLTKDDRIEIRNWRTVLAQMKDEGVELFDVIIRRPFEAKSSDQISYLMAEVAVKAMRGYQSIGVPCRTKEMAVTKLCLEEDIDNTDHQILSGGQTCRVPKSLSSMSMRDMYEFIRLSIIFIETELGMEVSPPEEFRKFYDEKIFRAKINRNEAKI